MLGGVKMSQSLRTELKAFIDEYGSKMSHISQVTGISQSMLSLFKRNQRNLSKRNYEKLKKFIQMYK